MYDEKHSDNCDDDAPSRIGGNTRKNNRYASDKYAENRDEARKKGDTSKSKYVWEYKTSIIGNSSKYYTYDYQCGNSQNRIYQCYLRLSLKYETKTIHYFFKDNPEVMIKKSKRSFFHLCKIFLYFFVFHKPYITQYVPENNLEKYTSYVKKLCKNGSCVCFGRYHIDEISNFIGYVLPLTERIFDIINTHINRESL